MLLAKINEMLRWAIDIFNTYIVAKTIEKVYIIAETEFGDRQDHIIIVNKALYGICSSIMLWNERFSDCIRDMKGLMCNLEPYIQIRKNGYIYQYIAVYVNGLSIMNRDRKILLDEL